MADAILVLNAGSSSIKFSIFLDVEEELRLEARGQVERIDDAPRFVARGGDGARFADEAWPRGAAPGHAGALERVLDFARERLAGHRLVGVGHRVVHGGADHVRPVQVDAATLAALERLIPLAPLHQPHNLAAIRLLLARRPGLPQIACFDTAFHRTIPALAQRYALPAALHEAGVRRWGFHGLSYEHVASVLPRLDPPAAAGRTVVLHLGNGASACALHAGRSVATTMGFSTIEGLPMGTRSGSLDPGVLLWLMDERGLDARAIERLLYAESGLLGVSGLSSDVRTLLASDAPGARLAIDLLCHRIRCELGALAAALGGLDALVFTAGVGENAAPIRERVCRDAEWLGVELDPAANAAGGPRLTTERSRARAFVVAADEERVIARHVRALLAASPGPADS